MKEYASYSIGFLQDFNMVKIESRLQTLSIRQAFLNGGESHSSKKIPWPEGAVRVRFSSTVQNNIFIALLNKKL